MVLATGSTFSPVIPLRTLLSHYSIYCQQRLLTLTVHAYGQLYSFSVEAAVWQMPITTRKCTIPRSCSTTSSVGIFRGFYFLCWKQWRERTKTDSRGSEVCARLPPRTLISLSANDSGGSGGELGLAARGDPAVINLFKRTLRPRFLSEKPQSLQAALFPEPRKRQECLSRSTSGKQAMTVA